MKRIANTFLIALITLVFGISAAYAVPTLKLTDPISGAVVMITDEAAGDLYIGTPGAVTYAGNVGLNWTINVTTGLTKPVSGTAVQPYMDLNSVNSSKAGGTLYIEFSETGFGPDVPVGAMNIGGTVNGAPGSSLVYDAYLDLADVLFGQGALIGSLGPFGSGPFAGTGGSGLMGDASFSLTQYITLVHGAAGNSSFNAELIPEPSTLLLLGFGLSAVGIIRLRRKS